MMRLSWSIVETSNLIKVAREFIAKYAKDGNLSQIHNGLKEDLREYLKGLYNEKRQPAATHVLVIMVSDEERKPLILPKSRLELKDDDDEDVFCTTMVDRYTNRALDLEDLCLADFIASYNVSKEPKQGDDFLIPLIPGESSQETPQTQPKIKLLNNQGLGLIYKCSNKAVMRWHNFNKDKEPEQHYRSKLMLFLPWRNENTLQSTFNSYQDRYVAEKDTSHQVDNCEMDRANDFGCTNQLLH